MQKTCTQCNNTLQGNQQKYCSNACKQRAHWYREKGKDNTYHRQTMRAIERKMKFIKILGGSCKICGYNNNLSALEFHHKKEYIKSFNLDTRKLSNTKESILLKELEKCDLLCVNCHREHHYPELSLKIISSNLSG